MDTEYYLKDPRLTENESSYSKYSPVGVCGYIQDDHRKLFNNGF